MRQSETSNEHVISVCETFTDPRPWAECSCGWVGSKHAVSVAAAAHAMQDGREHQREMREASDA